MNVKTIAIVLAGLVLVGGGIWWFTKDDSGGDSASQTDGSSLDAQSSIKELLAQNQNLMCTFSDTDEQGNASSGTVYLSDGRMSGDFSLRAPGEDSVDSHVINDGQDQYLWQEGENEGVKISLEQFEGQEEDFESDQPVSSVNQDEDYRFDCQQWNVDESRFVPPSGIDFVDYSQQFQAAQEEAAEALAETCSQLTDAQARAACEGAP